MKRNSLSICLAVVLGGVVVSSGQVPVAAPHPHSLSLHVEPVHTGGSLQVGEGTRDQFAQHNPHEELHTHQTETSKESEGMQVSVRNFSPVPDTVQIEWYFVGIPAGISHPDQQFIFDKGSKIVTIAAGATETFPVASKDIVSSIKRKNDVHMDKHGFKNENSGRQKETGSVLNGWMVRVVADGRPVDAAASKDQLTEIIKTDAKLRGMKGF